jgi:hypothetical protein
MKTVVTFVVTLFAIWADLADLAARFVLPIDAGCGRFIRTFLARRGGRVAEGGGLLNRYTV